MYNKSIHEWSMRIRNIFGVVFADHEKIDKFIEHARRATLKKDNKIIFIGNGGSAAIASHMAEDYSKNGNLRSITFNDAALLTCYANDFGYENVFSEAIKTYADEGDILVAISSSGKSINILNACKAAKELGLYVVTLSGFSDVNPLRQLGDLNFYVSAYQYGFVEISHLAILHAALDVHCEDLNKIK